MAAAEKVMEGLEKEVKGMEEYIEDLEEQVIGRAAEIAMHKRFTCDRSGMNHIIGTRYNLRGEDYDLARRSLTSFH